FHVAGGGEVRRLDPSEDAPANRHQHWALDPKADRWRVDVMAEPGDATSWVYRRKPSLQAPRGSMVGRSADGIPHLRLHGALLFKAKATRPKDRRDFDAAVPALETSERSWLLDALEELHPGHPWIRRLI
ncbi:MAG: amino acid transporter, partial [Actinomycetota bacterium]